jgi:hypothetical protein
MQKCVIRIAVCLFVLASARNAAAQLTTPWTDRGYFNFNGGFESVSGELNDTATGPVYGETASLAVSQAVDSGSFYDFSGGARIWRNFSVGIGFHEGGTHSEAAITGSIPHPLFFNQPRPLSATAADLSRSERAVHVQFGYMIPINDKLFVHAMLGPSFFKLRQDVVSGVTVTESGNFSTVTGNPVVTERQDTPTGFNIGADISYILYQKNSFKVGGGMFLRYAGASATIQMLDASSARLDSDVGGLQVGFGVRTRF